MFEHFISKKFFFNYWNQCSWNHKYLNSSSSTVSSMLGCRNTHITFGILGHGVAFLRKSITLSLWLHIVILAEYSIFCKSYWDNFQQINQNVAYSYPLKMKMCNVATEESNVTCTNICSQRFLRLVYPATVLKQHYFVGTKCNSKWIILLHAILGASACFWATWQQLERQCTPCGTTDEKLLASRFKVVIF